MADVTIYHRRQARCSRGTECAQQIVRVQIKVSFFHPASLAGGDCVTSVKHIAALDTNHTSRTAIDMNVSGMIGKTILSKDGTKVKIKAASDLYPVGASYGVHKLESDPPHWSADGH